MTLDLANSSQRRLFTEVAQSSLVPGERLRAASKQPLSISKSQMWLARAAPGRGPALNF